MQAYPLYPEEVRRDAIRRQMALFSNPMVVESDILEALRKGPMTSDQLLQATGHPQRTVINATWRLLKAGLIESTGRCLPKTYHRSLKGIQHRR